jgi:hypothetical protein
LITISRLLASQAQPRLLVASVDHRKLFPGILRVRPERLTALDRA